MLYSLAVITCFVLQAEPDTTPQVKEFPAYSCRLRLPDTYFKWSDKEMPPDFLAECNNGTGISLVLLARDAPKAAKLDDSTIDQIRNSYRENDPVKFMNGKLIVFKDVPCYQYLLKIKAEDSFTVVRTFTAHQKIYTLFLNLPSDQLDDKENRNRIFDAFEFIGESKTSKPSYKPPIPETRKNPYRFFTSLLKYFFVIVGAIFAIGLWYRNRNLRQDDDF
ncbi:hypothetical protein Enr10x_15620 [Gimesia panareensis]|uniref:PsbP C-terminal domain-containing protein n=1 Tax=Gimesia panareensis TaxID=2527978 RepID=A0A517Q3T2_9PLAN|nr:hypothetical protein [Gimesia panareensis]QDT26261.1 hypothetical protein Enr10x_15620 [Gimesia panareensis]